jgi:hypothetical protein
VSAFGTSKVRLALQMCVWHFKGAFGAFGVPNAPVDLIDNILSQKKLASAINNLSGLVSCYR